MHSGQIAPPQSSEPPVRLEDLPLSPGTAGRGLGSSTRNLAALGPNPLLQVPLGSPPPCHLPPTASPTAGPGLMACYPEQAHAGPSAEVRGLLGLRLGWRWARISPAAPAGTRPTLAERLPSSPRVPRSRRQACWFCAALGLGPPPQDWHGLEERGVTAQGHPAHAVRWSCWGGSPNSRWA